MTSTSYFQSFDNITNKYFNVNFFTLLIIILSLIVIITISIIIYLYFHNNILKTAKLQQTINNIFNDPKIKTVNNKIDILTTSQKNIFISEQNKFKYDSFIKNLDVSIKYCIDNNMFTTAHNIQQFKHKYITIYKLQNDLNKLTSNSNESFNDLHIKHNCSYKQINTSISDKLKKIKQDKLLINEMPDGPKKTALLDKLIIEEYNIQITQQQEYIDTLDDSNSEKTNLQNELNNMKKAYTNNPSITPDKQRQQIEDYETEKKNKLQRQKLEYETQLDNIKSLEDSPEKQHKINEINQKLNQLKGSTYKNQVCSIINKIKYLNNELSNINTTIINHLHL